MKILNLIRLSSVSVLLSVTSFAGITACASHPPLETVNFVDVNQYMGKWYQIGFLPTRFQKNCTVNTTATYTLREDGKVVVENECFKNNGTRNYIKGTASIVPNSNNSKLKVKFFWFAPAGDYYIIDLATDYSYALVGAPSRKFLWILSRTPTIKRDLYESILKVADSKGFDRSKVVLTSTLE